MEHLSEIFIGLPVAPNSGMGFLYLKTTKWRTAHPEGVTCPTPTSMGPISAGRGRVISGRLANRFGRRFATNTKLFNIAWSYWSYIRTEWLSKYSIRWSYFSLCGSCRNNAPPPTVPMGKPSTCTGCCDSLPACVKSFSNMLFVGQIETYSLAMDS